MSKKIEIHQFDPVLYPYKIWVIVSDNLRVVKENFTELNGQEITFVGEDNFNAMTCQLRLKENRHFGSVIIFKSKKMMSTNYMAHESCHAAKQLFEHIGADMRDHEPFEYLLGWIVDCCEQVKKNKFK